MSEPVEVIARELVALSKRVENVERTTASERSELAWFRELWARTRRKGFVADLKIGDFLHGYRELSLDLHDGPGVVPNAETEDS